MTAIRGAFVFTYMGIPPPFFAPFLSLSPASALPPTILSSHPPPSIMIILLFFSCSRFVGGRHALTAVAVAVQAVLSWARAAAMSPWGRWTGNLVPTTAQQVHNQRQQMTCWVVVTFLLQNTFL